MPSNTDNNGQHGQAVEPLAHIGAAGARLTTGASSDRVALPTAKRGYRMSARGAAMYLALGTNSVSASADSPLWLAANESIDVAKTPNHTHVAAIQDSDVGELRVTPLD